MVHVSLMFLSEWREFPSAPCLAKKKNLMGARVSMLLKSRASPDMLPLSLCTEKRHAILHTNRPLFPHGTIDSVLRYREVGRAKDLSAPPRSLKKEGFRTVTGAKVLIHFEVQVRKYGLCFSHENKYCQQ